MKLGIGLALGALGLGWWTNVSLAASPAPTSSSMAMTGSSRMAKAVEPADRFHVGTGPVAQSGPVYSAATGESCKDCFQCEESCCNGRLIAGAGYYYLKPYWTDNPAYFFEVGADWSSSSGVDQPFDYDYEVAPRVWLGFICEDGFGVRGRYWHYDHNANSEKFILLAPPGFDPDFTYVYGGVDISFDACDSLVGLSFSNDLRLDIWDLEVMQEVSLCHWSILLSGGARYAHIRQRAYEVGYDPGFLDLQVAKASNRFQGVGPTVAAEARRGLCCGVALYGSARGSILFGNKRNQSNFVYFDLDAPTPVLAEYDQFRDSHEDVLPISELELGLEWGGEVCDSHVFVQVAWVGQAYHELGSATHDGLLGMHGLSFTMGVQR
jgi:hypothetical protein